MNGHADEHDATALDGVVAEARFAGAVTHYRVQTFGAELLITGPPHQVEAGARVRIRPAGQLHAFPDRREHARTAEPA